MSLRTRSASERHRVNVPGLHVPVWVQLVRAGNTFSAYYSTDGIAWTQLGTTQTVAMNATALVGLAVTSHNNGIVNTATFDNLSIVAPANPSGTFNQPGMFIDGTTSVDGLDGNGDPLSDWQSPQSYAGEMTAAALGYYNSSNGTSPAVRNSVYRYSFTVNRKPSAVSHCPVNASVRIFAIDLISD